MLKRHFAIKSIRPLFKGLIVLLILGSSMNAQDVEWDLLRLQECDTRMACLDTLETLLHESHSCATNERCKLAQQSIDTIFSKIGYWRSHNYWSSLNWDLHNLQEAPFEVCLYSVMAWELYYPFVKTYSILNERDIPLNPEFSLYGYRIGALPQEVMAPLAASFENVKREQFFTNSTSPGYVHSQIGERIASILSEFNRYFVFDAQLLEMLKPVLEALKDPIAECFGTPWRVTSVRGWETPPGPGIYNPTCQWHRDGYPDSSLKILLYVSDVNAQTGSTALELPNGNLMVEGTSGTWLIFKNSQILHRAVSPIANTRLMIEINCSPALEYDLTPRFTGNNARHPFLPWR